jgi:hypothetical protein
LDENNGRFGKTPEFPNGVYAYFATLDLSLIPHFHILLETSIDQILLMKIPLKSII